METAQPATTHDAPARLLSIDLLRGVAALAVVVTHLPFSWAAGLDDNAAGRLALPGSVVAFTAYGQYGVNLFLVISGFCIHMQWARLGLGRDRSEVRFFDFWRRRLKRLYPPYFVALLGSLAGLAVVARLSGTHPSGVAGIFGYRNDAQLLVDVVLLVFLAQNLNGASQRVGNAPFWSLALEEQLYLLYFPFLTIRRKWGWTPALALVVAVTFAWRAYYALSPSPPRFWYVVGPARWLEWILGAIAVEMHLGRVKAPRWLSSPVTLAVVILAALAVSPPRTSPGHALWTVPGAAGVNDVLFSLAAFVLVNWCCELDRAGRLRHRLATLMGRVGLFSYSLYLVHAPVMVVVKRVAIGAGVHGVPLLLLLRFGAALAAGYLFFRLVESHFLARSRPKGGIALRGSPKAT